MQVIFEGQSETSAMRLKDSAGKFATTMRLVTMVSLVAMG